MTERTNRELDAYLAEKIMGWHREERQREETTGMGAEGYWETCNYTEEWWCGQNGIGTVTLRDWHPSTDRMKALDLAEKVLKMKPERSITLWWSDGAVYRCSFFDLGSKHWPYEPWETGYGRVASLPLAISRAAEQVAEALEAEQAKGEDIEHD